MTVRQFPPRQSFSNLVNLLSRYGTWPLLYKSTHSMDSSYSDNIHTSIYQFFSVLSMFSLFDIGKIYSSSNITAFKYCYITHKNDNKITITINRDNSNKATWKAHTSQPRSNWINALRWFTSVYC